MRVHYYSYNFQEYSTDKYKLFNLSAFLQASCLSGVKKITHNIKYMDDYLYLIRISNNFYLFVQTKSDEIVRAIQRTNSGVQATDIADKLSANESLGFASYLYVDSKRPVFAFGAKVLSPTVSAFTFYISQLLISLAIRDVKFCLHPIKSKLSKKDVHQLSFVGRTTIQINAEGNIMSDIVNALNGNSKAVNLEEITGLEITLKPKRRKEINNQVLSMISNIPDNELEKITMRARTHLEDTLSDYYYSKDGLVSDFCDEETDALIEQKVRTLIESNTIVSDKVNAFLENNDETIEDHPLVKFSSIDHWVQ